MDLFDVLWDAAKDKLYCTKEEYLAAFDGWSVDPVERGGVVVAVRVSRGPEFHFVPTGAVKSATRADITTCVQPIIDRYGYATTKTPKTHLRQHRFNELLGFVKTGEDEFDIHYRIERLRHA